VTQVMARYRKKPVVIDAIQWTGRNWKTINTFITVKCELFEAGNIIEIGTLEGVMSASPGDFIIKGVNGEFCPCKPDIFAATYEEVE